MGSRQIVEFIHPLSFIWQEKKKECGIKGFKGVTKEVVVANKNPRTVGESRK